MLLRCCGRDIGSCVGCPAPHQLFYATPADRLMEASRRPTQEYVEAAAPSFVVGEFWSTCVYDDQGHLVYNQVNSG